MNFIGETYMGLPNINDWSVVKCDLPYYQMLQLTCLLVW